MTDLPEPVEWRDVVGYEGIYKVSSNGEVLSVATGRIREKMNTSQQPAQNQQEFIHDPAEIRRVFEIDAAEWPEPESGFAMLGKI